MVIKLSNPQDGQSVALHLPLFIGDTGYTTSDGSITVSNTSLSNSKPIVWPVINGAFKVWVKLKVGENVIQFIHEAQVLVVTVIRYLPELDYFVRPVYIVCCDHDGTFQGPDDEDCSVQSALDRIKLASMLLQTFTAEKMKDHGFGHKTFLLETDQDNEPLCRIFRSQLTLERAHSMSGPELWTHFANELMTSSFPNKNNCKWFSFMSFTRYHLPENTESPRSHSDVLKYTKGHTALGGGGLALFGTGNLHTWAKDVEEIYSRFTDNRKIDRTKFMDDSAYREYYWANYATGLGAALHELGHTFDLAHTPSGIMARGFDDINRFFTVQRHLSEQENNKQFSGVCEGNNLNGLSQNEAHIFIGNLKTYFNPGEKLDDTAQPLIINLESKFKPIVPFSLKYSVRNYNGTWQHQIITDQIKSEVVNDMHPVNNGGILETQCRKDKCSSCSLTSLHMSNTYSRKTCLQQGLLFQQKLLTDGGAHWYRSSAVLLFHHRWFNKLKPVNQRKSPEIRGNSVTSSNGLCLIELRSDPNGEVFQFWEFEHNNYPRSFYLRTGNIPEGATHITIFVEDEHGLTSEKKLSIQNVSII